MISGRRGIILLLMIVLLSAFLSIAMGIVNILLGQLFIIGQAGESFEALFALDSGMERTLYRDFVQHVYTVPGVQPVESKSFSNGSCYQATMTVAPTAACPNPPYHRCMIVKAQSNCANIRRYVERQFDIRY